MCEWREFTAKTVEEALTEALVTLETTSDNVEYEVIEKQSNGILGLFSKDARIRVKKKMTLDGVAKDFLSKMFEAMNIEVVIDIDYDEDAGVMNIELNGPEMGLLIGKRGQTLDSIQYLASLVVNKESDNYIKLKVDTENYRQRRKDTLENLAKNIAHKVKKTYTPVTLEPMNPYERRVIHSALQNDKYVETHSEGDEPYRKVVVTLKKGVSREYNKGYRKSYYGKDGYRKNNYHRNNRKYNNNSRYDEKVEKEESTESFTGDVEE